MSIQDKPDFVTIRLLLDCISCNIYPMSSNNHQHTSHPKCRNKMLKIAEKKKNLTSINHTLTCLEDQMKKDMENENK